MATYGKYDDFTEQLIRGVHDFDAHVFKVGLATGAPDPTDAGKADLTETASGDGYTTGGNTTTIGVSESGGVTTVTATDPAVWTASGAGITFRYAFLYNDTAASDNLIAYWDNVTPTTITAGNTLTVDFSATLFTLT